MLASLSVLIVLAAPELLAIPTGGPVTLDAKAAPGEWAAALEGSKAGVRVRLKRTGPWLAVAATGENEYAGEMVYIAVADESRAWVTELTLALGQPSMPPVLWRRGPQETLLNAPSGAGSECPRACLARADFSAEKGWTVEHLIRLSALGIGRGDHRRFTGAVFVSRQFPEPEHLFSIPPGRTNPLAVRRFAQLRSADGWGADERWPPVTPEQSRAFDGNELLFRLHLEHEAFSDQLVADALVISNAILPFSEARVRLLHEELERGRQNSPGLPAWDYFIGRLMHESNQHDKARAIVESLSPPMRRLDPFANLAAEFYLDTEEWEKALAACQAAPRARGMLSVVKQVLAGRRMWKAEEPRLEADKKKDEAHPRVRLVTAKGNIDIELFEDDAPNIVLNFMDLVLTRRFYDGLRFHEVAGGRLVRVGDPRTRLGSRDRSDGPAWRVKPDASPRPPLRGYVTCPTRSSDHSAHGSQFAIAVTPLITEASRFTVFGRVVAGMEVVDALEQDDRLERVEILSKRKHPYEALSSRVER